MLHIFSPYSNRMGQNYLAQHPGSDRTWHFSSWLNYRQITLNKNPIDNAEEGDLPVVLMIWVTTVGSRLKSSFTYLLSFLWWTFLSPKNATVIQSVVGQTLHLWLSGHLQLNYHYLLHTCRIFRSSLLFHHMARIFQSLRRASLFQQYLKLWKRPFSKCFPPLFRIFTGMKSCHKIFYP